MIPVTRHMGALTQMLLQVALALPQKGSASLATQEFACSVPAITHPCEVVTLRPRGLHMKFCCPLRTRKPLQPPPELPKRGTRAVQRRRIHANCRHRTQHLTQTQTACLIAPHQHPPSPCFGVAQSASGLAKARVLSTTPPPPPCDTAHRIDRRCITSASQR